MLRLYGVQFESNGIEFELEAYQAKCGVEIDGARSDYDQETPDQIDSSRDVLGVVTEKVDEQRRHGKEKNVGDGVVKFGDKDCDRVIVLAPIHGRASVLEALHQIIHCRWRHRFYFRDGSPR